MVSGAYKILGWLLPDNGGLPIPFVYEGMRGFLTLRPGEAEPVYAPRAQYKILTKAPTGTPGDN